MVIFLCSIVFPTVKERKGDLGCRKIPQTSVLQSFQKKQTAGLDSVLLKYWFFSLSFYKFSEIELYNPLFIKYFPCLQCYVSDHLFLLNHGLVSEGTRVFFPLLICGLSWIPLYNTLFLKSILQEKKNDSKLDLWNCCYYYCCCMCEWVYGCSS